jgi:hypothetical protein
MLGTHGHGSLASQVSLERTCTSEEASGTVTNESDQTLDIRVEAQFYAADDVLLSSSQDSDRGLRAGRAAGGRTATSATSELPGQVPVPARTSRPFLTPPAYSK